MKRLFDFTVSAAGLLLFGWLILVLVVVIRLSSPGPGLFLQERVGRGQQRFRCCKLRTMAEGTPHVATHHAQAASITRLGRWLRRVKLDELPQLWNVLKGEMSLVGPRPCLPVQAELIAARERRGVFALRPGITGRAQVLGVDMSDPERLARIDAEYAASRSFAGDLRLLVQTFIGAGRGDRVAL
ncbi:sugar transferase [Aurantimonas endophytica]|uniref:Lipopolysaccharide/colanic/teichoic acid biosynthesis glycosyltransferase n=1 Tax=Aurantimonas endophytica TaxID=1522175 RepID=A0A7W6MMS4_9HYPH|nr:sugar transferase [Aurantimonas endophytica]MBB4001099.1 lipopolysaccharide/colanic/teichoic acid biosynthesis glycosyltransferase [Aurantimonas endophytica]MCO6403246.1 sugar transferase [Aurantimonas endophytica]